MNAVEAAALITAAPVLVGFVLWLNRISSDSRRIADAVLGFTDKRTGTVQMGLAPQILDIREHQEHLYERLRDVEMQLNPDHKGGLTERLTRNEGNTMQILDTMRSIREVSATNTEAVRKAVHDATQARTEARAPAVIVGFQMNAYARKVKDVLGHEGLPDEPIDIERLLDQAHPEDRT